MCGEAGEKVGLFAGTYRSALGLSRTFILADSPQTLELQLQGDDLVEVFLVFPRNVFGLEPATVRVREVRIGRSAATSAAPEGLGDVNMNAAVGTGAPVSSSALESPGEHDDFFDEVGVSSSRPPGPSDNPDNTLAVRTMTGAGHQTIAQRSDYIICIVRRLHCQTLGGELPQFAVFLSIFHRHRRRRNSPQRRHCRSVWSQYGLMVCVVYGLAEAMW